VKYLFFVLLALSVNISNAQSVDEVIDKYTLAMGGLESINKIKTARITGNLVSQGSSYLITIHILNGKSMLTEVTVNGQTVINAYDKGKGWKKNPFENIHTPTEVKTADDLALLKLQTNLANNLMDYKKRGHQVVLAGQEDIDSIKTYKIILTSKDDGKKNIYYIGTTDYMLVRSDSKQKIQGKEYDAQTYYSDTKDINGLKFSAHFVRKIDGIVFQEVTYDKIELDIPLDEKLFSIPGSVK